MPPSRNILDVSIEQVAALSSQNTLPEPSLDLSRLQSSGSTFAAPVNYRQNSSATVRAPAPAYSSDDPWNTNPRFGAPPNNDPGFTNGAPSSLAGTGLPKEWWTKQETVRVNILGPQGFILNRYMVYEIVTNVRLITLKYTDISFNQETERRTSAPKILRICVLVGLLDKTISIPVVPCTPAKAVRV